MLSLDPNFEAFLFGSSAFLREMSSLSAACVIEVESLLKRQLFETCLQAKAESLTKIKFLYNRNSTGELLLEIFS